MIDYMRLVEANGKNVRVTDTDGKIRDGYCHCYAELNDDDEIDVYIVVGTSMYYPEDIAKLEIMI